MNSTVRLKQFSSLIVVVAILSGGLGHPQSSRAVVTTPASWDVAVLDEILAAVPPGESLAQVGDMQILVANLRAWRDQLAGEPVISFAFDGVAPAWTGGNVFYTFDASVSPAKQKAFLDGAAEWAMFANLHFIPRTSQANYITIRENPLLSGGQSAVGMVGGQQFLEIGPGAWSRAVICHEIGHALGLVHEHQRSDRDSFVTILTNNILPGSEANFVKLANSLNTGAYDFLSVMHYRRDAFSVSPGVLNTIQPLPAYAQFLDLIGQQYDQVLSPDDRAGLAAKYGAGPVLTSAVTNTLDSGPGSLRAALYYALDHPGTTITFNIPTSDPGFAAGVFTIQPTDNFPGLLRATVLDGSSQPGNSNPDGPEIVLNGALCDPVSVYSDGLRIVGTNCVVQSFIINGFPGSGLVVIGTNATGNSVRGCYLGVNASGTAAATNRFDALVISGGASRNTIGGTNATARNIISGSAFGGLLIRDAGTRSNTVSGNYIGLNAAGTAALPNANAGLLIYNGAQGNIIGGTNIGSANVISGNLYQGLGIAGTNTTGNVVMGNFLGLNAAGTAAVPNTWSGVSIFFGATSNVIGGLTAAARNVISGNSQQGLIISEAGTSGNVVVGNYIGLNAAGTAAVPNGWSGVQLFGAAQHNTIGGSSAGARNIISGNSFQGVLLVGTNTSGNLIAGNFIGLNPAGAAALANGWSGLEITGAAASNLIGGTIAGAGNIISGNNQFGCVIGGGSTDGNIVLGNVIGLDVTGAFAVPNGWTGLALGGGARGNVIGGTTAPAGNVISGNLNYGVTLNDANTDGNLVQGNRIGLDATGTFAVPNIWSGLSIGGGARSNVIGGTTPAAGNVVSGNLNYGVTLVGANTSDNLVQGNRIGLNAAGTQGVANGWDGVSLYAGASRNVIGLAVNGSGAANHIAFNAGAGFVLFDSSTTNNTLRGNNVFSNGLVGINLFGGAENFWGVTFNDFDDSDTGPNQLQNHPILTQATGSGLNTLIAGTFNGAANRTVLIDLYRNDVLDASGNGEGQHHIGSTTALTDGGGAANFGLLVSGNFSGQNFTATATDQLTGNTSEFSPGLLATNGPALPAFTGIPTLTSTGFLAQIALNIGQNYRVQTTTNVGATPVVWADLTNFTASVSNYTFLDRAATNFPQRFYRVISP